MILGASGLSPCGRAFHNAGCKPGVTAAATPGDCCAARISLRYIVEPFHCSFLNPAAWHQPNPSMPFETHDLPRPPAPTRIAANLRALSMLLQFAAPYRRRMVLFALALMVSAGCF